MTPKASTGAAPGRWVYELTESVPGGQFEHASGSLLKPPKDRESLGKT